MQATDGVECFEIDRDSVHEETKKTSIVWRYIFPVEGSNSKLKNVYCSICDRKLSYNGSTTTNLLKHFNQKHQEKIKVDDKIDECEPMCSQCESARYTRTLIKTFLFQ